LLQANLQEKENKSKDNPQLYERFLPGIISSIADLKAENQQILESKVRFVFPLNF